jgi:hypothetical protein
MIIFIIHSDSLLVAVTTIFPWASISISTLSVEWECGFVSDTLNIVLMLPSVDAESEDDAEAPVLLVL